MTGGQGSRLSEPCPSGQHDGGDEMAEGAAGCCMGEFGGLELRGIVLEGHLFVRVE